MQIVIEIPKAQKKMVDAIMELPPQVENDLISAIRHGTPLPEHHGRLMDADAYINKHEECGWLDDITVDEFNKITPTIISATKECTDCRWYGFTCECPVHCTQDTKIAWEPATKEGEADGK